MASIYVGTYAKYNAGSIEGKWLDPEDYADKDAFLEACADLHKDEADPELMFQDWEDIPEGMVTGSHVEEELWDWLALDDHDRLLLRMFRDLRGDGDIEDAREAFNGTYTDAHAFAHQLFEDLGYLGDDNPLVNYVDWGSVVRDLSMDYSFVRHEGETWVFRD